jgi:hypothetical protein
MSEMSISWGELANLTHITQVEQFNFCLCEDIADDQDTPYADCPTSKAEPTINDINKQIEEGATK